MKFSGDGRFMMSMIIRNGVITMAQAIVTIIQYHLLVNIDHSTERSSRMKPMFFYVLK
jgi:hypothetical protein